MFSPSLEWRLIDSRSKQFGLGCPNGCYNSPPISGPCVLLPEIHPSVCSYSATIAAADTKMLSFLLDRRMPISLLQPQVQAGRSPDPDVPTVQPRGSYLCATNRCQRTRPRGRPRARGTCGGICKPSPNETREKLQCHPKGVPGSSLCHKAISPLSPRASL